MPKKEQLIIYSIASVNLLLHLFTNYKGGYGLFRDELYYIACSSHLDFGYVDHPPLSIFLLKISQLFFGDSLFAIRLLPAFLSSATIFITGTITKEMGGRSFAIFLACLAVFISPIHTVMGSFYSMNFIDIFIWALSFYLLIQLIKKGKPEYWLWLGIVLGLGLLNKISVLFLGAGLLGGLLLTEERKWLTTRWPYISGIIALALFLPYIIWNINHDFAHLEFIRNASGGKYSGRTQMSFILEGLLYHHPLNILIWLPGVFALFFFKPLQPFKVFGWIYLITVTILLINKTSKGEYLSPTYCVVLASGGVFIENILAHRKWIWLKFAYPTLLILVTGLLLPTTLPVLPVEKFIVYSQKLGITPSSSENKELSQLPQFYADMFGWKEKAKDVANVFNSLSREEQKECVILSNNYGRCGAIDYYGKEYGLPKSIGTHNNYWIWGPGEKSGDVMIILGGDLEDHIDNFQSVKETAVSVCQYCMPYENHVKIFLCRGIKPPLKEIWPAEKHYE